MTMAFEANSRGMFLVLLSTSSSHFLVAILYFQNSVKRQAAAGRAMLAISGLNPPNKYIFDSVQMILCPLRAAGYFKFLSYFRWTILYGLKVYSIMWSSLAHFLNFFHLFNRMIFSAFCSRFLGFWFWFWFKILLFSSSEEDEDDDEDDEPSEINISMRFLKFLLNFLNKFDKLQIKNTIRQEIFFIWFWDSFWFLFIFVSTTPFDDNFFFLLWFFKSKCTCLDFNYKFSAVSLPLFWLWNQFDKIHFSQFYIFCHNIFSKISLQNI